MSDTNQQVAEAMASQREHAANVAAISAAGGEEQARELLAFAKRLPASRQADYAKWLRDPSLAPAAMKSLKHDRDQAARQTTITKPTTIAEYHALQRRAVAGDPEAQAAVLKIDVSTLND